MQAEDDLGVEVEVVGVRGEVDVVQRVDSVGPVSRVPLAEGQPGEGVLHRREDAVADVLVRGHPARTRRALRHHSRAEDRISVSTEQRVDHRLNDLRRVLAVAVKEHDDVEAMGDRPFVAGLLVPAVAKVLRMAHDREGQLGAALVGGRDGVRVVLTRVVADEDVVDSGDERLGQPIERLGEGRRGVVRDDEDTDPLGGRGPLTVLRGEHR